MGFETEEILNVNSQFFDILLNNKFNFKRNIGLKTVLATESYEERVCMSSVYLFDIFRSWSAKTYR